MFLTIRRLAGRVLDSDTRTLLKGVRWTIRESWFYSGKRGVARIRATLAATGEILFGPAHYVVFWPAVPYHDDFILCKILARLRVRPTTNPRKVGAGSPLILFRDTTCYDPGLSVDTLFSPTTINGTATDIRKSRVDAVFAEVSGRSTLVDPTTHVGPAVEKSELNGSHNGRVVMCPIPAAEGGSVYQKLIENVDSDGRAVDMRVVVVRGSIPLVYIKRRQLSSRFSNTNDVTELVLPDDVFSPDEVELILAFAQRFGLDLGELDVLRDASNGRLSIIDVNNTPFGPPNGLSPADSRRAIATLTQAFRTAFLTPVQERVVLNAPVRSGAR